MGLSLLFCLCVNVYCHRVTTQLQLIYIYIYIIFCIITHNGMNKPNPGICKTAVKLLYSLQATTYHSAVLSGSHHIIIEMTPLVLVMCLVFVLTTSQIGGCGFSLPPASPPPSPVFRSRRSHQPCAREHLGAFRGFLLCPLQLLLFIIWVVRTIIGLPERDSSISVPAVLLAVANTRGQRSIISFNIYGSMHRKYSPVYIQQDANLHSLFISGNCSTWYHHSSSGAHTTVSRVQ